MSHNQNRQINHGAYDGAMLTTPHTHALSRARAAVRRPVARRSPTPRSGLRAPGGRAQRLRSDDGSIGLIASRQTVVCTIRSIVLRAIDRCNGKAMAASLYFERDVGLRWTDCALLSSVIRTEPPVAFALRLFAQTANADGCSAPLDRALYIANTCPFIGTIRAIENAAKKVDFESHFESS